MVRIKFMKINGLYSYGSEQNRIDFGEKTLIVGPNNSGKSSIFKALDFFLRSLTEYTNRDSGPWHGQDAHEMTVMFALNESERRYTAEALLIRNIRGTQQFALAQRKTVEWLACRLKNITLTIRWIEDQFSSRSYRPLYILHLDELVITINSIEYNSGVWAAKDSAVPHRPLIESQSFGNVMEKSTLQDSLKNEFASLLAQRSLAVTKVPVMGHLNRETLTLDEKSRIQSLLDMSENRIPHDSEDYSFFVALGRMLRPKFIFISEQRRFPDSNDLEKAPLKEDGSNLHSFLFWLKNGDKHGQEAYAAIQDKLTRIHSQNDIPFSISVTEKQARAVQQNHKPVSQVYPDRTVTSFPDTSGQEHGFVDFAYIGAGIKEALFLLSSCFVGQDKVICMDEPASNLHPTLIKRLMHEILTPGGQVEPGQIAVITHSPAMASLDMLSSANKIVRIDRHGYSEIVQPSEEGEGWIAEHLATFHLLKPDILFSHRVVLVEGESDRIFVEAILNLCAAHEGSNADYIVVNVCGKLSFKKFQTFLNIFRINFVILADGDAEGIFESKDATTLTVNSLSQNNNLGNKTVYILEKDLEYMLACLDREIYDECERLYEKKPELSYHFITRLLAENTKAARITAKIAHLIGSTNDNGSFLLNSAEGTMNLAKEAS